MIIQMSNPSYATLNTSNVGSYLRTITVSMGANHSLAAGHCTDGICYKRLLENKLAVTCISTRGHRIIRSKITPPPLPEVLPLVKNILPSQNLCSFC